MTEEGHFLLPNTSAKWNFEPDSISKKPVIDAASKCCQIPYIIQSEGISLVWIYAKRDSRIFRFPAFTCWQFSSLLSSVAMPSLFSLLIFIENPTAQLVAETVKKEQHL